jgi:hypothetical protein
MKPCLPFYSSREGQVTGVEGERKTEREKKGKKVGVVNGLVSSSLRCRRE